jgi:voltage-gated potassium channel
LNKEKLRSIIEDNTTLKGKVFDYIIQSIIFLSLVAFAIETLPNNSESVISILNWIELISVLVFSVEFLIRIYVAKVTI